MNAGKKTSTTPNFGLQREGSPYTDKECEEIISKLEELLDGEIDEEKQKEVQEMIQNCDYCLEQYKIEKSLRELVKEGFKKFNVSSNLLHSIKNTIKNTKNGS